MANFLTYLAKVLKGMDPISGKGIHKACLSSKSNPKNSEPTHRWVLRRQEDSGPSSVFNFHQALRAWGTDYLGLSAFNESRFKFSPIHRFLKTLLPSLGQGFFAGLNFFQGLNDFPFLQHPIVESG